MASSNRLSQEPEPSGTHTTPTRGKAGYCKHELAVSDIVILLYYLKLHLF